MRKKALAFILSATLVLSFAACGGSGADIDNIVPGNASTTEENYQEPNSDLENVESDENNSETVNGTRVHGMEDTLCTENFDLTIQSASVVPSITNELGVEYVPEAGNVFLLAVITAKNTNNDVQNMMNVNFNSYVDGSKIVIQSIVGKIDGNMPLLGAVSSEMEFTGYTVWEIPQDWESLQFSYIDALSGSDSDAFIIYAKDII